MGISRKMQKAAAGVATDEVIHTDVADVYRHRLYASDDNHHSNTRAAAGVPSVDFRGVASTDVDEAFAISHITPNVQYASGTTPGTSKYEYKPHGMQVITNGLNLKDHDGFVFVKLRHNNGRDAKIFTSNGGILYPRYTSNATLGQTEMTGFLNDGFVLGDGFENHLGNCISYSFRCMPKFMDIVEYTGDGTSNRQISHSLNCDVGMMWIKQITSYGSSGQGHWIVWHRTQTGNKGTTLNTNEIFSSSAGGHGIADQLGDRSNVVAPTSTQFTVGTTSAGQGFTNYNGATYKAFLFAHDTSSTSMIKCDSFITNSNPFGPPAVNLGWQPQFVLIKCASLNSTSQGGSHTNLRSAWHSYDIANNPYLSTGNAFNSCTATSWNHGDYEYATTGSGGPFNTPTNRNIQFTPTGFDAAPQGNGSWDASQEFVYMAIRAPEYTYPVGKGYGGMVISQWSRYNSGATAAIPTLHSTAVQDANGRLRTMQLDAPDNENTLSAVKGITHMTKGSYSIGESDYLQKVESSTGNQLFFNSFQFKDNQKFFRQVAYTGNGTTSNIITHNLRCQVGAIWIKRIDDDGGAISEWQNSWACWHVAFSGASTDEGNLGPVYWFIPRDESSGISVSDIVAVDRHHDSDYYINSKRCIGQGSQMGITDNTIDICKLRPNIGTGTGASSWDYSAHADTIFNVNNAKYVMMIFANDRSAGSKIRCGSASDGIRADIGFHPGLVLVRGAYQSGADGWHAMSERTGGGSSPRNNLLSSNIGKGNQEEPIWDIGAFSGSGNRKIVHGGLGGYAINNDSQGVGFTTRYTGTGSGQQRTINDPAASYAGKILSAGHTHLYIAINDGNNTQSTGSSTAGHFVKNGSECFIAEENDDLANDYFASHTYNAGQQYMPDNVDNGSGAESSKFLKNWPNGVHMAWGIDASATSYHKHVMLRLLGQKDQDVTFGNQMAVADLTVLNLNTNALTVTGTILADDGSFINNTGGLGTLNNPSNANNGEIKYMFRKAPCIFDLAHNFTATGSDQLLKHSLGCQPAMVWMKDIDTSTAQPWYVFLRPDLRSTEDPSTSHSYTSGFLGTATGQTYNSQDGFYLSSDSTFQYRQLTLAEDTITIPSGSWSNMGKGHDVGHIYLIWGDGSEAKPRAGLSHYPFKCGTFSAGSGATTSGFDLDFGKRVRFLMLKPLDFGGSTVGDWLVWDYASGFSTNPSTNNPHTAINKLTGLTSPGGGTYCTATTTGCKITAQYFTNVGTGRFLYMGYT